MELPERSNPAQAPVNLRSPCTSAPHFYSRLPFWYGLLFPLGYTAGALMAVDSVRRRVSGRVVWKGRIYS